MAFNVALARKVLEHIEAHPEEFDMDQWGIKRSDGKPMERVINEDDEERAAVVTCNTSACLAGWAVTLDPDVTKIRYSHPGFFGDVVNMTHATYTDGTTFDIENAGAKSLGLDFEQPEVSFYSTNESAIDQLKTAITEAEAQGLS